MFADNNKLRNDSYGYPGAPGDGLLSLVNCPFPAFEITFSSSSVSSTPPLSFENPFDDISMEPLPLRSHNQRPSEDCLSSSTMNPNVPTAEANLLCESLIDMLHPLMMDLVGSKRSSEDLVSNIVQGPCKRQRTSHVQDFPGEESTARFRPYQEKQWQAQFRKLVQFKLVNGHCCVPHSYSSDPILARWVKRQRYQYKKFRDCDPTSTMTTRRIQELESIGFVWHSHASAWQEKVNDLMAFKQRTGHCNVPSHYAENAALSTWVKCQRRQYKLYVSGSTSSTMTLERFQLLKSLGFVFDIQKARKFANAGTY
ncbi:unnamed protein product [Cylindrotheca closterium]|uniref:Helicase-associated domain-containing protein n=1 Tax=Cylindrotheca closterium TaxID=2856 RepID=A0AAD2JHJ5_9STRA|nr:unnamed protein product [Cylindrotheca closterium]